MKYNPTYILKQIEATLKLEYLTLDEFGVALIMKYINKEISIDEAIKQFNLTYNIEFSNNCYVEVDDHLQTSVLSNKFNIYDEKLFNKVESFYFSLRLFNFYLNPIEGNFDLEHLKNIHKYLFEDLFCWAGKIRTVLIAKKNMFCLPQYIETYANDIFTELKKDNYYLGQHNEKFIVSITNLLGDINALHPFREGNGRTQREFVRLLCNKNGYDLDWSKVTPEENIIASVESINGNNTKLKMLIEKIMFLNR